jgi:hypothetical protein
MVSRNGSLLPAPNRAVRRIVEDEKPDSGPNGGSTDYVLYRGGSIQTAPRIYVVYWGDWSSTGDPYNVQNRLFYFLLGLGGSNYTKVLTQYAQGCYVGTYSCPSDAVHVTNPAGQFKSQNYWKDPSPIPATPTAAQVAAEAARAAAHFGDYGVNVQYVVALPRGHGDGQFVSKGGLACAWHDLTWSGSNAITYTDLPYMPDAGGSCGNYSVTGSILDGVSIIESHEYAESVTDPWATASGYQGWFDSTGLSGEVGDKCNWAGGSSYVANVALLNGSYPVQAIWSNYARYYYGNGCVFS